jgi:hypothetical protein
MNIIATPGDNILLGCVTVINREQAQKFVFVLGATMPTFIKIWHCF